MLRKSIAFARDRKYSKQAFAFALDRNGKIYSWGENSLG
jgi:alpha-tubulin suppressor-like RCC1 family protein